MNNSPNDSLYFNIDALNDLKLFYQRLSGLSDPSVEVRLWLAQYQVLVNQLKSRNVHGTVDQLKKVSEQLLQEARQLH